MANNGKEEPKLTRKTKLPEHYDENTKARIRSTIAVLEAIRKQKEITKRQKKKTA